MYTILWILVSVKLREPVPTIFQDEGSWINSWIFAVIIDISFYYLFTLIFN